MTQLQLKSSALVVLEGLDRSGKTTQRDLLRALDWANPAPMFTHMPSGLTALTESIYQLTEANRFSSPLARQLLHLTCHAENIDALARARTRGGIFLDRWWWSTVAYGWYGGALEASGVRREDFFGLIDTIWSAQPADLIFLFTNPYERDDLNRDQVREGYDALAAQHSNITVRVPMQPIEETSKFLLHELTSRDLLSSVS